MRSIDSAHFLRTVPASTAPSDLSGSPETDLDLEQAGSLAPGANVLDYQAPNTDSGSAPSPSIKSGDAWLG